MTAPEKTRGIWPPLSPAERVGLPLALGLTLSLLIPATLHDMAGVVYLAQFRETPLIRFVNRTMFEGHALGLMDVLLWFYLGAIAVYVASFVPGLPGWLGRMRSRAGYVMAASLCTGFTIQALKLILARPRPSLVLGGRYPFAPWYELGAMPPLEQWRTGSFPSGHTATAALVAVFALTGLFGTGRLGSAWLWALAAVLTPLVAVSRVLSQDHWPSDVVAGGALAFLVAWALFRVQRQAGCIRIGADGARDRWNAHPAANGAWAARLVGVYFLLSLSVAVGLVALRAALAAGGIELWALCGAGATGTLAAAVLGRGLLRPS